MASAYLSPPHQNSPMRSGGPRRTRSDEPRAAGHSSATGPVDQMCPLRFVSTRYTHRRYRTARNLAGSGTGGIGCPNRARRIHCTSVLCSRTIPHRWVDARRAHDLASPDESDVASATLLTLGNASERFIQRVRVDRSDVALGADDALGSGHAHAGQILCSLRCDKRRGRSTARICRVSRSAPLGATPTAAARMAHAGAPGTLLP